MKRTLWLTLFLAACSSAPELQREFHDGPMVSPAPTFTTPGATPIGRGGPMVGQPGYVGPVENIPRGTDQRVLPPTREPGIWASDSDPTRKRDPRTPPPGRNTAPLKSSPECGLELSKVQRKVFEKTWRILTFEERRCLNLKMEALCAEAEETARKKYAELEKYDPRWKKRANDIDTAEEFAFAALWYCDGVDQTRVSVYYEKGRKEFFAITGVPK